MLPFLKPQRSPGVIVSQRKQDGSKEEQSLDSSSDDGLMLCAHDLISAVHAKDSKAVAAALKAAFQICDAQPHEEGEHLNTYNEQNAKAAKGQE